MTDVVSEFKRTSATQMKSFKERGHRYWYFKWRMKLKEPERDYFTFGTRLHSVAERWLRADDILDRDLYPVRWDADLDASESALIRVIFEEAIELGLLTRVPGRHIELKFDGVPMVDGIVNVGYIDLLHIKTDDGIPEVHDHKTAGKRSYAKSPNALSKDWQMLLYAKMLLLYFAEQGWDTPEQVRLTHLYYFKDRTLAPGKRTRRVSVVVDVTEIEDAWSDMRACVREMIQVGQIERWQDVKCNGSDCAYRNCPYVYICGLEETPDAYRKRIDKVNAERLQSDPDTSKATKEVEMPKNTLLDDLRKAKNKAAKSPPAQEAAKPPDQKLQEEQAASGPPPWASKDCPACGGKGWNTKKNPCRICVNRAVEKDGEDAKVPGKHGIVVIGPKKWEKRDEEPKAEEPAAEPAPKAEEPVVAPKKSGLEALMGGKEPPALKPPEAAPQPTAASTEPEPKRGSGRPAGAKNKPKFNEPFILCIGCTPVTKRPVVDMTSLMVELGDELAVEMGAEGFYALDPFQRRDALGRRALQILERVPKNAIMYVADDSPDIRALVSALRPFTGTIIQANR